MRSKAKAFFPGIAASLLAATPLMAQPQTPPKPRLIVAIAVDQFSTDLFNQYRTRFQSGLKRLSQGIVFPRGHQSHAATETCPGHSTILTGSRPARSGIIANDWQDPALERKGLGGRPSHDIYCAEKPGPSGSDAGNYVVSADFLKVPTLGDRLKAITPATRVFSVSGKDRAAVMMGGHQADVTIWWNGKAFATYAGREASLPRALPALNARALADIAKPAAPVLPAACAALARPMPVTTTLTLGTLEPRKAGDAGRWRASPGFDALTMDIALAGVAEMQLGKGAATDVLAISLSGVDYVGHSTGTAGAEMCTQIMGVDDSLGRLFAALDKAKIDYVVTLTADHGGHDAPERNRAQGLPAAERVDPALSSAVIGAKLAAQFGIKGGALLGRSPFGDQYLSPDVPASQRAAVLAAAVAMYRAHPQVAAGFTKEALIAAPPPQGPVDEWSLIERAKASFDPERSGDFLVLLKQYVTPIPAPGAGYVATHGSPWGYDRRVPILFWWKGAAPFEQPNAIETVDILPTVASLIGLDVPSTEIDGRCLDLIAGVASNCR